MSRHAQLGLRTFLVVALGLGGGCSRDVRLAGKDVRKVEVRAVTHYGVTLDRQASPEQVAYVLLRAIRDDFQAQSKADREAARDKQFDICAANVIRSRNRTGLSEDEFVYNVVYRWTPTVAHYVNDFETEWDKVTPRMLESKPRPIKGSTDPDALECEILMELADPGGDPNARVVMIVWLAKDSGFWRVVHLGFDPTKRAIGN